MRYNEKPELVLFIEFLSKNRISMKPCTPEQLQQLMQMVGNLRLPSTYLQFMGYAGNGIRFFKGSSYTMREIENIQTWAQELLSEDESLEILTSNDFVFFMHQGYQFYFFKLDEGDNPPIYYYEEGENHQKFIKKYDSFSEFVIAYYNDVEHLIKDN